MEKRTFDRIYIHTTDADYNKIYKQFFAVNRWHKERFGYYFNSETGEKVAPSTLGYYGGYTILIEPDGTERRYREDWEETMAVKGENRSSLSVALSGDGDIQLPPEAQAKKLKERVLKWCNRYNIPTNKVEFVAPHRLSNPRKTCFGSLLPDDYVVKLLHPEPKDEEGVIKKGMTEAQRKVFIDAFMGIILQLMIMIEELKAKLKIATRQKTK